MAEAIARGGAVKVAAESEVLSAKERAAIEFAVAERLRGIVKATSYNPKHTLIVSDFNFVHWERWGC